MPSPLFEHILVPTDLSDLTDLAVAEARRFQTKLGARVTLLHARELSWLAAEHPIGYYIENEPEEKLRRQHELEQFAKRYDEPGFSAATMFVNDNPARAILNALSTIPADLIVIGTHARRAVPRILLGSVTSRVLRETKTPVITVSPDAVIPAAIERVLCPVNFSDAARTALEESASIAEAFGAQLIVMHVLDSEPPLLSHVNDTFAAWVDPLVRDHTSYEHIICHGDAALRIAEAAEMIGASLVVVGAQQAFLGCRTLLGSSSAEIIRACRRPVLTVMCPPAAEKRHVA